MGANGVLKVKRHSSIEVGLHKAVASSKGMPAASCMTKVSLKVVFGHGVGPYI